MNRNSVSHFSTLPTANMSRSKFNRPFRHLTSMNTGDLVPFYVDEVLPGDTVSMDVASLIRMSTPIYPVMDDAMADIYWFYVPNRLLWDHWKELNGENNSSYWAQEIEYEVPQTIIPAGGFRKGSIADYMGIPTGTGADERISSLPFRAYTLIWNEWFRDQNLKQPAMLHTDDSNTEGSATENESYITRLEAGGKPAKVAKYHDYFTSALPQPQKGEPVGISVLGNAPVVGNGKTLGLIYGQERTAQGDEQTAGLYLYPSSATDKGKLAWSPNAWGTEAGSEITQNRPANFGYATLGVTRDAEYSGLVVDKEASLVTVNELRTAFQIQRLLETDARSGSRYTEVLRAHFGVVSPDARQQRPEYLGGTRININMTQVVQTSGTTDESPQGNTAAFSMTTSTDGGFTKSFTEHGILMGLVCIRTVHTYQQGVERMWWKKKRLDFYWPTLANIGEQAILNREIYLDNAVEGNKNAEAFGYQEAWADYRYKPNRVSSAFRSTYAQPLDSWHYADYYTSKPTLSSEWIDETRVNVDRTLAVTSELEDQFICDFYCKGTWVRPMPMYSVPGLIDHH